MLQRNIGILSAQIKKLAIAYKALVRSKLEYTCTVTLQQYLIDNIEKFKGVLVLPNMHAIITILLTD